MWGGGGSVQIDFPSNQKTPIKATPGKLVLSTLLTPNRDIQCFSPYLTHSIQAQLPRNAEMPLTTRRRTKTERLSMNTEPRCWHSFTSRCKCPDLKFSLSVLCLATLMLYLCWGLFSLQQKNLCLNGSALKVAPTAFNGLQTRLDPWLPSLPIPCIQRERNQPV